MFTKTGHFSTEISVNKSVTNFNKDKLFVKPAAIILIITAI